MDKRGYAWTAVDIVIDYALDKGIKYRRSDFRQLKLDENIYNSYELYENEEKPYVQIILRYSFPRCGKLLESKRRRFKGFENIQINPDGIYFTFVLSVLKTLCYSQNNDKLLKSEDVCINKTINRLDVLMPKSMNKKILPEGEIILRLNEAANRAGVKLTYTINRFFIMLLNYIQNNNYDDYTVSLTMDQFVDVLKMPKRTVIECVSRLTKCGAIIRVPGMEIGVTGRVARQAHLTTINKNIIEQG